MLGNETANTNRQKCGGIYLGDSLVQVLIRHIYSPSNFPAIQHIYNPLYIFIFQYNYVHT